jgi:hypothetical protein
MIPMDQTRETLHLFDLMFKAILHDASHPALVHFINGLFGKSYPTDSPVAFAATESVSQEASHLTGIRSDMLLTVAGDAFIIEAQIQDDETIALRIFQYSLGYAQQTKRIESESITLTLPDARIIYWETSQKTPDTVTIRIIFPDKTEHAYEIPTLKMLDQSIETLEQRHLVLLAPFYVLKYRKTVKHCTSPEKRLILAKEMRELIGKLEAAIDRAQNQGIISATDGAGLFERLVQMYTELYTSYPEFKEEAVQLAERVKTQWQDYLQQGVQQERNRLLALLNQGYTTEQLKTMLTEETSQNSQTPSR